MTLTAPPPHTAADHPPAQQRRTASAGRAIATVAGSLLVASFLNADALARVARQQPDGWQRTAAVAVTSPIEAIADVLQLDRPRAALDALTGTEVETADEFGGGLHDPPVTLDRAPPPDPATSTTTTVPTTTTTLAPRRTPTPANPLRVLFAGDSLIGNLADGFGRLTAGDARVAPTKDVRVATGLARPDVLDWPTHLEGLLRERNPEVVVLMFGGNDDQPLRDGDRRFPLLGPGWAEEYRRRVALMMDVATRNDRTVIWIGVPVVERAGLQAATRVMNDVAYAEAARRPRVSYFDPDDVIAPGGAYAREIDTRGGRIEVRARDGVHVTQRGADLLAPRILGAFAEEWHLVDPAGGA
jgi:hypothetical protein